VIPYTVGYINQDNYLPIELQNFLYNELDKEYWWTDGVPLFIILLISVVYMGSLIGIYRFKEISKTIFITISVILLMLTIFIGPFVHHGVVQMASEVEMLVTGVIISLLLFTNVFEFKPIEFIEWTSLIDEGKDDIELNKSTLKKLKDVVDTNYQHRVICLVSPDLTEEYINKKLLSLNESSYPSDYVEVVNKLRNNKLFDKVFCIDEKSLKDESIDNVEYIKNLTEKFDFNDDKNPLGRFTYTRNEVDY
jgi:hypothetical protein